MNDIKLPSNILIGGSTAAGKSFYLRNTLLPSLKGQYDVLVVFSPTMDVNGDYDYLKEDEKTIFKVSNRIYEATEEIIATQTKMFKQAKEGFIVKDDIPRVLLIYDDCLNSRVFNDKGLLSKFAIKSRHYKVSILVTTQRIAGISRQFRLNCSQYIFFSVLNYSELERIVLESVPKKYQKGIQDRLIDLYKTDFAFLFVNNRVRDPSKRFFISGETLMEFE